MGPGKLELLTADCLLYTHILIADASPWRTEPGDRDRSVLG
jgi:hypothetical protein